MRRLSAFNVVSLTLGFAFLYIPILILVIYSFNESRLVTVWAGFSTKWYGEMLSNQGFMEAAWVTLQVAVMSSPGDDPGHNGRLCADQSRAIFWTHAVFGYDLCTACHA